MSEETKVAIPIGYEVAAQRDDLFLHTDLKIYRKWETGGWRYIIVINNKMSGPFSKQELECLQDCLKNDLTFK